MTTPATPIPARLLPQREPAELLALARQGLANATQDSHDAFRYGAARLAALRAAAALVADRAEPVHRRPKGVPSVWTLLPQVAPEFAEWAAYFAGGAEQGAAAAGIPGAVSASDADGLLRATEQFVAAVEAAIGGGQQ